MTQCVAAAVVVRDVYNVFDIGQEAPRTLPSRFSIGARLARGVDDDNCGFSYDNFWQLFFNEIFAIQRSFSFRLKHFVHVLFCDSDFVFTTDVEELFAQADDRYAIMCVKHDYTPKNTRKMDGKVQLQYPRKNWSSCMLFNAGHEKNKILTPDLLNHQTALYLHRMQWLEDDLIGELSCEWNWLAGWYEEPADGTPKAIHYTEGGPWFDDCRDCEYADVWNQYHKEYNGYTNGKH